MAISPLSEVDAVIGYAVTRIPPEKILMGISEIIEFPEDAVMKIDVGSKLQRTGPGHIPQLMPAVIHGTPLLSFVQHLKQAHHRPHLGGIGIGGGAVPGRIHAVEQRHMAGQRDRGHHRGACSPAPG